MRASKEESQNIIWFACYHKDEDSKEMKRTRLRDLKDSEENLVERKITQDASGNRSVRGVRARSARILTTPVITRIPICIIHIMCTTHLYHKKIPSKATLKRTLKCYENLTRASRSNTGVEDQPPYLPF